MNAYLLILKIPTGDKDSKNTEEINILKGIIYNQFVIAYFFVILKKI